MIAVPLGLALVALPAPSPPHAVSWPEMQRQYFQFPDGRTSSALFWREGTMWRFREVDQDPHPIHLDSPLGAWDRGLCNPDLCRPLPPGALPGDVGGYRPLPANVFTGPPE